jgi:hypothetical protein
MRRLVLLVLAVLAVAAYPAGTVAGVNGNDNGTMCALLAQLRGANEVPPRASEAFGHTLIKIRNDATLEFDTHIVNDGALFIAGHVHGKAPVGVNAPVVVPLLTAATSDDQIRDSGEVLISPALAQDICDHPDQYYVNYHTTLYPGGAIRGQLG